MEFNLRGFLEVLFFQVSWMEANLFFVIVCFCIYAWFLIRIIFMEGILPFFQGLYQILLLLKELILLLFVSIPRKIIRSVIKKVK